MTTLKAITTINEMLSVLRADSDLAAALNMALSALRERHHAELPQQDRQSQDCAVSVLFEKNRTETTEKPEKAEHDSAPYPMTIVQDRYGGRYSGGAYTAWLLEPCEVPGEIGCGDLICSAFWDENKLICGKGDTPDEAERDLLIKIRG